MANTEQNTFYHLEISKVQKWKILSPKTKTVLNFSFCSLQEWKGQPLIWKREGSLPGPTRWSCSWRRAWWPHWGRPSAWLLCRPCRSHPCRGLFPPWKYLAVRGESYFNLTFWITKLQLQIKLYIQLACRDSQSFWFPFYVFSWSSRCMWRRGRSSPDQFPCWTWSLYRQEVGKQLTTGLTGALTTLHSAERNA